MRTSSVIWYHTKPRVSVIPSAATFLLQPFFDHQTRWTNQIPILIPMLIRPDPKQSKIHRRIQEVRSSFILAKIPVRCWYLLLSPITTITTGVEQWNVLYLPKNKIRFINGTLPKPSYLDSTYDLWDICNNMVLSWITRTLSPHIFQSTICIESAFELWKDLEDRFSKGNFFRVSDLLRDLHSTQ